MVLGVAAGVNQKIPPGDDMGLVDRAELLGIGNLMEADELADRIHIGLPGPGRNKIFQPHGLLGDRRRRPGCRRRHQ